MRCIDLHADTISALMCGVSKGSLRENTGQVDIMKLIVGGVSTQFLACYFDKTNVDSPYQMAKDMIRFAKKEMAECADAVMLARSAADIKQAEREGKIAAFLTIEEGGALEGKSERLAEFYEDGVRLITLTWNYPNEIGYPNIGYRDADKGLTSFGREIVSEMERLGMLVDVSHLSDKGFYDVAEMMTKPFIASHSNARSITEHSRNLTDDMIRRVAEAGGVIGLNFANIFLGDSPVSRIADMVRHARHIYEIGGRDVLALGSDFDGIDPDVEIRDASMLSLLWDSMAKDGFTEDDIDRMQSKNVTRVLKDCL
ncbi:MAG: dipeptidase [Selenomonadales bacterium]|nr:dipeptidase [Selenomonadales bacterium]